MAAKSKPVRCKHCNYVIKKVSHANNGWGHKKREHWLGRPHKAVPQEETLQAPEEGAA